MMQPMKTWITLSLLAALPALAAVEFTAAVSSGPRDKSTMRGQVDGENARIEFLTGKTAGMEKGSYMLTRDGGKTIYLVNPAEKSFMKIDPEKMAATAGEVMNAAKGFVDMSFSNPTVETLLDEQGPTLFGLPTRRVKTKTAYTMETRVFGSKNVSQVTREDEMLVTQKMLDPGFNLWMKQRNVRTGNADIDKLIELENARIKGMPLKVDSITRTRDPKGRVETATSSYEITALRQTSAPPASAFVLPEGYKDTMAEMGEGLRQVQKDLDEDGDTPPAVKDTVNSLMKGLFGR